MSSSSRPLSEGIRLKPGRDGPILKRHHPWIFSQAVDGVSGSAVPGAPLPVLTSEGKVLGWGLHSPGSLIAVRMVTFDAEAPPQDWIEQRIRRAAELRELLRLDSDAYRIVNSEGDFIPGLILDRYANTIVASAHTRGIEALMDRIRDCVRSLYPGASIYCRRDEHFARVESLSLPSGYLEGSGDGGAIIREGTACIRVDFAHGQKTGFYLDQRGNRRIIAHSAAGRRVLNLFAYTGAVALEAALAGAAHVVSVESSHPALEAARASADLNPEIRADQLEWVQEDVFSYLEHPSAYDTVIADPPPFARRRAELDGALKGYLTLFTQCLRNLPSGGLAFLFSCSGAVDRPTFRRVVAEAGLRAGRELRLLRELHADADHPTDANHPEGEYLKGWMIHAR